MKLGIAILSAVVMAVIAYMFDVPTSAGAHPIWADQVLLSGVVAGTLLAVVTIRLPGKWRMFGFSILAIGSYLVAEAGKARFAASYAEDAVGGQMWYFGWHAVCAFMVAATISTTYNQLQTQR
jgi:hypothetical protein